MAGARSRVGALRRCAGNRRRVARASLRFVGGTDAARAMVAVPAGPWPGRTARPLPGRGMPTDFLRPLGLHTEPRQDQQSRQVMLLAERSLVLEGPALINAVLSGHALSGKGLRNLSLLASEERSLPPLADLQTPELDALVTTPAHETSQMLLPRSRVDKGLQSWQCSTCTRYMPEASIIWGTDSTNWPWRAECRACKSAQVGARLPSQHCAAM